jgi:hypothetical protein
MSTRLVDEIRKSLLCLYDKCFDDVTKMMRVSF